MKKIFFRKEKISQKYKINTNYNLRYYNRIISDKTNFKDNVLKYFKKFLIN